MSIQYNDFIHPSDKKALEALKAVPGFDLLLKKFMSIVGEKMFQIEATSSYLKLGPDQLPEVYNILVKVCKKLQIEIPELYLALDREPNAYTFGDTDIFIVINSGLIEVMTLEQLETVIAHECGHIVCHHVLYHTLGRYLLLGAEFFVNGLISQAVVTSLQYAFYYWMRCSEFSADRVAAFYHESAEPVIDTMLALSGGTHNLKYNFNREAFFKQAQNYRVLVDNSTYNKVLEFIQFGQIDHPLNAYRAYEIDEFYKRYSVKTAIKESKTIEELFDTTLEHNLRIRYEYIKPKYIPQISDIFNNNQLEVKIEKKKYLIDKNDTIDVRLKYGEYDLKISNSIKSTKHHLSIRYDTNIVVAWDCTKEKFSIREEI